MREVLFQIFYEVPTGLGWTLAVVLVTGIGTATTACFALSMARRRIAQDFPELDPEQVKAEILRGNEN